MLTYAQLLEELDSAQLSLTDEHVHTLRMLTYADVC
jgi:hypothetical protein